ncbi:MAG: Lrp/AsnC ligand binding domain-containing protein [archaeon]|nr:Lrp/AsnC ligand binding domain-containing protein [archaeon]
MARLLAFVNVFVDSPWVDDVVKGLSQMPNVEEIYEVTGEFDIVSLVSASGIDEFRNILKDKIMKIKGVKSTVSSVVLHAHKGSRSIENGRGLLQGRKISA